MGQVLSDLAESNSGYSMPPVVDAPAVMEAVTAPINDAVTSAADAAAAVTSSADAIPAAAVDAVTAVSPPVEAVSPAAVSAPIDDAELVAAKKRILELET